MNKARMVDGGTELVLHQTGRGESLTVRSYRCESSTKWGADPQSFGSIGVTSPQIRPRKSTSPGRQLRSIYHATPAKGRQIAIKLLDSFHTCPIPEVARLGRTLRAWKAQILAYFDTSGISNGGTEAINLIIEKVRRLAHGFKDFDHYRLRIMLAADGRRPYRTRPNHA
jgi:hypothetical protein